MLPVRSRQRMPTQPLTTPAHSFMQPLQVRFREVPVRGAGQPFGSWYGHRHWPQRLTRNGRQQIPTTRCSVSQAILDRWRQR